MLDGNTDIVDIEQLKNYGKYVKGELVVIWVQYI